MGCKLLDVTYIMEVGPGHELPTWMCFLFKQLLDIFFLFVWVVEARMWRLLFLLLGHGEAQHGLSKE